MTRIITLLLLGLMSCIGTPDSDTAKSRKTPKDYTSRHAEALAFCKKEKYCDDYYFLVDMSIHSGRNRFFVYDFRQKKITDSNVTTHGSCDIHEENDEKWEKAKYSNADGSHCTALGKYRIGKRDYSSWGIKVKYWMHGLEKSNSNAVARVVVLHSWTAVPDMEVYPDYAPLSWGCPAVSDNFMRKLDEKLKKTSKPVLLWIIE